MSDVFRTIIIPAPLVDLARALGVGLSPGGVGMFTTGLSASGTEPATHFVSTGLISERFAECITSPEALHTACTEAGAQVSLAMCQALVNQSDVSTEDAFTAFARLNLQLVQLPTQEQP